MIGTLIIILIAIMLVAAALAPLESLAWWAWNNDNLKDLDQLYKKQPSANSRRSNHYLIYFSGIGAISGTSVPQEEYPFLAALQKRLPKTTLISNIYPYSMTNNGLTSERMFAKLWKMLEKRRFKNPNTILAMLVNMRNTFQLFVSSDPRYGPIYNFGIARLIYQELLKNGYQAGSKVPITIVGWSGGGQIALGAATYLAQTGSPLRVISIGGMLSDDIGLSKIGKLWHLFGTKDPIQAMGKYLFAGRWPGAVTSQWHQAMRLDKIEMIELGPHVHMGKGNYFDLHTNLPGQKLTFGQKTLDVITKIIINEGLEKPPYKRKLT